MILILSDRNDSHANYLIEKLHVECLHYYRLDLDVVSLKSTSATYNNFKWKIIQNGIDLNLDEVACIWHRRTFVELLLDEEYDQSTDFKIWKNEWNKTLLGIYNQLKDKPWLNYWRNSYKAENKYLQIEIALSCGFKIPDTIISNDKKILTEFVQKHNEAALKFMQQDFYKNESGEYRGLYVNKININDLSKFAESGENPIVLQQYVEKDFEVRYTVVSSQHFACKIESQKSNLSKVDWRRYDIPNTPHEVIEPPKDVKSRVDRFMNSLDLTYGALDFIVTPQNEWYFLEVNSMGQYLWIEDLTGLPITEAIISWMKNY